jgi:O-antigen/teichoic acid export membrane protein
MLSVNEIAFYYILINIGGMTYYFDFGFSNQFARVITYIFAGAQDIQEDGLIAVESNNEINFHLLKIVIKVAQYVYRVIGSLFLLVLLTIGTLYIFKASGGFTLISHTLIIWFVYGISVSFNLYYMYLNVLLIGKGAIEKSKKAIVFSRIAYFCVAFSLLLLGCGLISIIIANFIAPMIQRFLTIRYFYTDDIKEQLGSNTVTSKELKKYFKIIWFNVKKMGIVVLSSLFTDRTGMLLAGLYLLPWEVASYGLLIQIMAIVSNISLTMFNVYLPQFSAHRITNNMQLLLKDFSLSAGIFYFLFLSASIFVFVLGNPILILMKSNVLLPGKFIPLLYMIILLLENNHSLFGYIIQTNNTIPFVKQALITGLVIFMGTFVSLKLAGGRLLSIIAVWGIVQLAYADWKWPHMACKELHISFLKFISLSFSETAQYAGKAIYGINRFFKKFG